VAEVLANDAAAGTAEDVADKKYAQIDAPQKKRL
jgi:hypothetical protein